MKTFIEVTPNFWWIVICIPAYVWLVISLKREYKDHGVYLFFSACAALIIYCLSPMIACIIGTFCALITATNLLFTAKSPIDAIYKKNSSLIHFYSVLPGLPILFFMCLIFIVVDLLERDKKNK